MRKPTQGGGPAFRFTPGEVSEMESCLQEVNYALPSREVISSLADKFSSSMERVGKITVQPKQVWNWFQNRRYAQRAKLTKAPGKLNVSFVSQDESKSSISQRNVPQSCPEFSEINCLEMSRMEFEAKSSRDGAWYDVSTLVSYRMLESKDPEVQVSFSGFDMDEDEWINVRKCIRPRSLPCEDSECILVLPGDRILCFQEGKDQTLYFDAHVLDAQRRRHDIRGCRCRFLVRYAHDHSEEIVPLRKICRRPETDYRLSRLHSSKEYTVSDLKIRKMDHSLGICSRDFSSSPKNPDTQSPMEGH